MVCKLEHSNRGQHQKRTETEKSHYPSPKGLLLHTKAPLPPIASSVTTLKENKHWHYLVIYYNKNLISVIYAPKNMMMMTQRPAVAVQIHSAGSVKQNKSRKY
jgi:hypothetical protein